MATRAEQAHANEEKKGMSAKAKKRHAAKIARAAKKGPKRPNKAAAKKATFAAEKPAKRASRKSTRASANRAKPEATLEIREEIQKGTPTNLARKSAAKRTKVRGKPSK